LTPKISEKRTPDGRIKLKTSIRHGRAQEMADDSKIRFALMGAGSVGRGIFHQSLLTPKVSCDVVCDVVLERALSLADRTRESEIVRTEGQLADALARGRLAVCEDAMLAARAAGVDVFFDASTAMDAAPPAIEAAMSGGKHVVMMNAEADATFGPWFLEQARKNGVVYTSSDGDQPAVIARLVDDVRFYGLDFVMGGNIKGFLDRYSDPVKIKPEADKRYLDPQMCASYTDGTKLCVEMALVANGLGCDLVTPGMLGPRMADVIDLFAHFDLAEIFSSGRTPVVDYVLGARPKGGVFVVGHTDDEYQRRMLDWFPPELGPGPFYVFTRPYHLIHLETMRTVIDAAHGRPVLAPCHGMRTEVVSYAKRPLPVGTTLDGPGGFCCYGLTENRGVTGGTGFPICLSQGVRLKQPVNKDGRIAWDDIDIATVPTTALSTYRKAAAIRAPL
jgi:predicted homoserine dehydrogenase-like protein